MNNIETAIETFWTFNMIGGDGIPKSIAEIEFEIFTRILIYGEFQQIHNNFIFHYPECGVYVGPLTPFT